MQVQVQGDLSKEVPSLLSSLRTSVQVLGVGIVDIDSHRLLAGYLYLRLVVDMEGEDSTFALATWLSGHSPFASGP